MIIAATELKSQAVMYVLILLLPALATPSLAVSREYHLVSQSKTWSEALSYCAENFHGLATLENEDDWVTLRDMIANTGLDCVWIGMYKEVNSWRWSLYGGGNTLGSWFEWDAGQPSGTGSCVCVRVAGWHDAGCGSARPMACSVRRKRLLKYRLKTSRSVDPNDPQVLEVALKQMEERLTEQGVNRGVRLRWRKQPDGNVFNKTEL